MQISQCQKVINDTWQNTRSNLAVEAGPGSGKTTTLLMLAKNTPSWKRSIFLCFNKSIQLELERKLPPHIISSTLHSLGMKQLLSYYKVSLKVNEMKTFLLIVKDKRIDLAHLNTKKKQNGYLFGLCKLYDLYRINVIKDIDNEIEEIALQNDLIVGDREIEHLKIVVEILDKYNSNLRKDSFIDFTDMLYLCKDIDQKHFKQYDTVFIDEGQDLSPIQKVLIDKIRKPTGRFCCVGDSKQAIYSFCGSNIRSFEAFKNEPNTVSLPLNITYRCAKSIVEEANSVFNEIEAYEANPQGKVLGKIKVHQDGTKSGSRGNVMEAQKGDLVLCRNNSPLVELFLEFLKRGKPAHIYGKDISEGLQKILDLCEGFTKTQVKEFFDKEYEALLLELEEKHVSLPSNHPKAVAFREKREMISILLEHYGSVGTLSKSLESIFTDIGDSKTQITLMSVHKSKGLEADTVWFYKSELIPSKYAFSEDMLRAEKCLFYVAVTRAKTTLIYC
jgi:superfamily I DNA/RNA helicase